MDEMRFGCVVSHPLYTYSANKKMEEELKRKEKNLLLQQREIKSRIWREKTRLFEDLIQLHVRTPNLKTKSTESEITEVGDVHLDSTLYSKVSPRKSGQKCDTSNIISPVLRVFGANVFCNMQKGDNLEMELQTHPRTKILLEKTSSICKCLETLAEKSAVKTGCDKCNHDRPDKRKHLQRAHTFHDTRTITDLLPQRRVTTAYHRSLTKDSLMETKCNSVCQNPIEFVSEIKNDKPNYLYQKHIRGESMDKFHELRREYQPTFEQYNHCSNYSKAPSSSHLNCKRDKHRIDAVSDQALSKPDTTIRLSQSIVSLKRTSGKKLMKRKMYVDSVNISRLAYRDKGEHYKHLPLRKPWCS